MVDCSRGVGALRPKGRPDRESQQPQLHTGSLFSSRRECNLRGLGRGQCLCWLLIMAVLSTTIPDCSRATRQAGEVVLVPLILGCRYLRDANAVIAKLSAIHEVLTPSQNCWLSASEKIRRNKTSRSRSLSLNNLGGAVRFAFVSLFEAVREKNGPRGVLSS